MTDLLIGNETFRIEVDGDTTKPALLLVHSLGSDLSQWDAQMPALLKAFRVIRYDSRGHGGSTLARAPYSIAMLGRDALGILDALEIETAHVVGISMGGAVAQWLVTHAPGRISRAVLANTKARFGATASWNSRIVEVLGKGMSGLTDGTMERWFGAAFAAREPKRIDAMRATFEATAPAGYAGCCAAVRDVDLREALREVTAPVLVISGRNDPTIGESDIVQLITTIPGAKHVALDARHISNIEADVAFTKAVVTFLTAKLPTRKAVPASSPTPSPAKAVVARRVGTRRSTAARIPLTAAPTSATASKTSARKTPASNAPTTPAAKSSSAPARKSPASPAPAKRTATKSATKPAALVRTPAKTTAARPSPTKKVATAKPDPKAAKRPSAKTLKAMAAASATKAKVVKAPLSKAGKSKTPTGAAPVARKGAVAKATTRTVAPQVVARAAKAPVAPKKTKVPVKTAKAKEAAPKTSSRGKSAAKAPVKTVARKTPPKGAPKTSDPKTANKSGRRAS